MINPKWLPQEFWDIVAENPNATMEENYATFQATLGSTGSDTPKDEKANPSKAR